MLTGIQTLRVTGQPPTLPEGRLAVDIAAKALWVGAGSAPAVRLFDESYADARYLQLSGGALTGHVSRDVDPTDPSHLARKAYVDAAAANAASSVVALAAATYLPLAGGALTGHVSRTADPTDPSHLARKAYVDAQVATRQTQAQTDARYLQLSGGTLSGHISRAADPTDPNHLARKAYVDAAVGSIGGPFMPLTGGTLSGGLSFNAQAAPSPLDLSRHIALWSTTYGFSVTGGTLNAVANAGSGIFDVHAASARVNGVEIVRGDRAITAGGGLTGGGSLSANRTISHADTSSQASVNNSGGVAIQDVALDAYGHVIGLSSVNLSALFLPVSGGVLSGNLRVPTGSSASACELQIGAANTGLFQAGGSNPIHFSIGGAVAARIDSGGALGASTSLVTRAAGDARFAAIGRAIIAGAGLTGGGDLSANVTINHADTSSVGTLTNVAGRAITGLSFDGYGHATAVSTQDFDARYAPIGAEWPGLYSGTSASNVTFPVGSYILSSNGSVSRSGAATLRLSTVSDQNYVVDGAGSILSGIYRARGDGRFFQRVS